MLKEIQCEKFKCNGVERQPIVFHSGLNTILGSEDGTNSIGKSTFLMIIDFAFGGVDYILRSTDVQKNVGPHTINFCFEFDGQCFYFSRGTATRYYVDVCDSHYVRKRTISLEEFCSFLFKKYQIPCADQTLRGAVGNYFRIYLRECCNEGRPLLAASREPDKKGITEILKLFDKYSIIQQYQAALTEAKDRYSTYRKAIQYNQISAPRNAKEYAANAAEIQRLSDALTQLSEKSDDGLLDIDSVKAARLANLISRLSVLRRIRTRLTSQIDAISFDKPKSKKTEFDFAPLLKYFPNANVKALSEVEKFHAGLTAALSGEINNQDAAMKESLKEIDEQIALLENEHKAISSAANVPKTILDSYADAKAAHDNLMTANKHYDEKKKLYQQVSDATAALEKVSQDEINGIAIQINSCMRRMNDSLYSEERSAPYISIRDNNHYQFETPNDYGTGSRYKGLILFDLAILSLTALPAVAHDSFMLKQIEDGVLEHLLEMYNSTPKQVFIAMDKAESYSGRVQNLLNQSVVLRLSGKDGALFGRTWNVTQTEVNS